MDTTAAPQSVGEKSLTTRVVLGGAIGNCTEWFDYGIYGYMATTMAKVFFPSQNSATGLLSIFAVFGIAFVMRPLGGLVLGPLGDKIGRQKVLVVALVMMALSTFVVGLLPGAATIGLWAPAVLVLARLVQGFSAGGEYSSAVTYVGEYAPAHRRGFLTGFVQLSSILGLLLSSAVVLLLSSTIAPDAFATWGWRIAFLLALPLGAVGIYIRIRLDETPEFKRLERQGEVSRSPLIEAFQSNWRDILRIFGMGALQQVSYYIALTYLLSYAIHVGFATSQASLATTITLIVTLLVTPLMGAMSDRVGRKPVLLVLCVAYIVLSVPVFALMSVSGLVVFTLCQVVLGIGVAAYTGTTPATYAEMVPERTRVACFSIGYNVAGAVFGGPALYLSAFLITATHDNRSPAAYLIFTAVISLIAVLTLKETAVVRLRRLKEGRR